MSTPFQTLKQQLFEWQILFFDYLNVCKQLSPRKELGEIWGLNFFQTRRLVFRNIVFNFLYSFAIVISGTLIPTFGEGLFVVSQEIIDVCLFSNSGLLEMFIKPFYPTAI